MIRSRQHQMALFIFRNLISAVGHQFRGLAPPNAGNVTLFQPQHNILPQRHGGRRCTHFPQEPVIMSAEIHYQGRIVFRRHLQQTHVTGGASLLVSYYDAQQFRIGGLAERTGQPLPRIDKVRRFHLPAIRPLCIPQAERKGNRTIMVFFVLHILGRAVDNGCSAFSIRCYPHQIFIQVYQHRLISRIFRIDGIQRNRRISYTNREGQSRPLFAGTACQHRYKKHNRQQKCLCFLKFAHKTAPFRR